MNGVYRRALSVVLTGTNESKHFVSCYASHSASIDAATTMHCSSTATVATSGDAIDQLQIANACRGSKMIFINGNEFLCGE